MNRILAGITLLVSLLCASSCSDSDNNGATSEKKFGSCFAYVEDLSAAAIATYTNVNYTLSLNYADNSAELTITNLRLPNGTAYPTMKVSGLRWKLNPEGWYEIEATGVKASVPGYSSAPTFTTLKVSYLERYTDGSYDPCLAIRYLIDATYSVMSGYAYQHVWGTLGSIERNSGSQYITTSPYYQFFFNMETRQLEVTLYNARFMEGMPSGFDIVLKNIPFTISGTTAVWSMDAIIPYIGDTPFPSYAITDLRGSYNFASSFEMSFVCEPRGLGTFDVAISGKLIQTK